ncbi:alpha-N-acetylglucosaminidase [Aureococcus anophagefferens]|uniref:Alpha-N-acetylglucosaminidase n=1 Tax=Aureococcus anophagefferens TaxID=44056 RepID=A0ABR1G4F0_AURAN
MVTLVALVALVAGARAAPAGLDYDFSGRGDGAAVLDLFLRVLKLDAYDELPFASVTIDAGLDCGAAGDAHASKLCVVLEDAANDDDGSAAVVAVRATSAVDAAYGAARYLRERCGMSFGWDRAGGDQVAIAQRLANGLPAWPPLKGPTTYRRLRDVSYGWNVCTASYTQAWWAWDDWSRHLDWLALNGVNLALAYTGQERLYADVYADLGVDYAAFANWSNGPAHLTWSRGQSTHGVGGPLPRTFADAQLALAKRILARMRGLGIVPVLPSFQGNVPPALKDLFPEANITVQAPHWTSGAVALDATDPLFARIGDAFLKRVVAELGADADGDGVGDATEHFYEADGYFAAGDPPWYAARRGGSSSNAGVYGSPDDARAHALGAYGAMARTDPDARWHYQGWILNMGDGAVVEAYVGAVPAGRLLVSDMWSEWAPLRSMLVAAGAPFLYGALQNFGGTLDLGMSVAQLAGNLSGAPPGVAEGLAAGGALAAGVGAFPEGIDQNLPYWVYFFDANWNGTRPLDAWWAAYAAARYGVEDDDAAAAWAALAASAYAQPAGGGDGFWREKARGGLLSAPGLHDASDAPAAPAYATAPLVDAWRRLAAANLSGAPYDYDVANVGREALSRARRRDLRAAALRRDDGRGREDGRRRAPGALRRRGRAPLRVAVAPRGRLLRPRPRARAPRAGDGGDAAFYDRVARAQVTTWLPACGGESDAAPCSRHANASRARPSRTTRDKAWGGLVTHYYGGRVRCYEDRFGTPAATRPRRRPRPRVPGGPRRAEFRLCARRRRATAAAVSARLLAKYFP